MGERQAETLATAAAMIETFTALLLAHLAADFLLQSKTMAERKAARDPGMVALHIALVYLCAAIALGQVWSPYLALLAAVHLVIDLAKSFAPQDRLWPFMADQGAHVISVVAIAAIAHGLWAEGIWAGQDWLVPAMALAAGLIAATRAGGLAVGLLLTPLDTGDADQSLRQGGWLIGLLERGLIYLMVIAGQPAGIGFLIAAKSILRFETARPTAANRKASEYIIIGTLASFGWAMAVSWGILALLSGLNPIGIPGLSN